MDMPSLFYADDVAGLSSSITGIQRLLHLVRLWSGAWHCTVSTKRGKTEAIAFVPGQTEAQAIGYAPLVYGAETVSWVAEYRYLGYPLRYDLDEAALLQSQLRKLLGGFHRYFTRNHVSRSLAAGLQVQLYRTTSASAADYLRSILIHSPLLCGTLDREILRACRHMLGHHRHTSAALVWATTQMLPTVAVVAREQERLHLQLTNSLYHGSLSNSLLAALAAEPRSRGSYQGRFTNWLHCKNIVFARLLSRGAVLSQPACYSDISRAAHAHGRSVGYLVIRNQLRKAYPPPAGDPSIDAALPPPSRGSSRHFASLTFHMWAEPRELGVAYGHTPLSLHGPGCSGSLLGLSRAARYPGLSSLNLGTEALSRWPFDTSGWRPVQPGDDDYAGPEPLQSPPAGQTDATSRAPFRERFLLRHCTLCPPTSAATELSPYHLACECLHPALVTYRRQLLQSVPGLVSSICGSIRDALMRAEIDAPCLSGTQIAALETLARYTMPTALAETEQRFICYWLLNGYTWPACIAADHQPAAAALGMLFDATNATHRWLRPLADHWLSWCESSITDLARCWRQALSSSGQQHPFS